MNATPFPRSEAFAEDLPGCAEEDPAARIPSETPLRALPWFTLTVALVGGSALTLVAVPL